MQHRAAAALGWLVHRKLDAHFIRMAGVAEFTMGFGPLWTALVRRLSAIALLVRKSCRPSSVNADAAVAGELRGRGAR